MNKEDFKLMYNTILDKSEKRLRETRKGQKEVWTGR